MTSLSTTLQARSATGFSPLVMSDRLIAMAMDADDRGDTIEALQWLDLAHQVLDRPASAPTSMPMRGSRLAQ